MPRPESRLLWLAGLLALASAAALLLGPGEVWRADSASGRMLLELRLPRVFTAAVVGGLLALSGVLMQVLLRNPLAEPYVLGVSGGAAVGALLAGMLGGAGIGGGLGAFVGALVALLLVLLLGGRGLGAGERLLLTGVVLAAGWGALVSLILSLSSSLDTRAFVLWLMGDLGGVDWPWAALLVLLAGTLLAWRWAASLDCLGQGDELALALGVDVARLRPRLITLAALLAAAAVAIAGPIGFIGLVVPHLLRLGGARRHAELLPAAVLAGATLLVAADAAARLLLWPRQLPVGVITALIGVPVFIALLWRRPATAAL